MERSFVFLRVPTSAAIESVVRSPRSPGWAPRDAAGVGFASFIHPIPHKERVMRRVVLFFLAFGIVTQAALAGLEPWERTVVSSKPRSLVIEARGQTTPGTTVPLGLVAIPEGGIVSGRLVVVGAPNTGVTLEVGDASMIRELCVVPVWLRFGPEFPEGEVEARIELDIHGRDEGSPPFRGYLPPSFAGLVRPHILNWDQLQLEARSPGLRYLIVSTDALAGSLGALVDWKERKGLAPQLATLSQTGTTDYLIRQYIRDLYNATGTLEYVLLVGDVPALPTHDYYNPIVGGYLKSDRYYATIVGGDDLPDVFIGRLPAASTADLQIMVNKILEYEAGTGAGPWMRRGVVCAGAEHPSQKGTKRLVRDWLLGFGFDDVDSVFAPTGTAVQLLLKLNEGRTILNYRGGVADPERWAEIGWTQDYCYYMQNGPRRPLVTSVICHTGNFTYSGGIYGECLGESFMRAAGGAIAFFGASQITHTFANNTLDRGIYDGLTQQGLSRIGPITDAGLYYLAYNYPFSDTVTVTLRQYNLLGDPEIPLWTREPLTMTVNHPSTVPTGTTTVQVSTGVSGALVCLRGSGVYEATYANEAGMAWFQVTPAGPGSIDVTVTHPGYYPYLGQMTVAATYAIGGTIRTETGAPLAGAVVRLTGSATGQVTTGSDGTYAFFDLTAGGTYTVTPSYSDIAGAWTFTPESRTFENLQSDQWGQDFVGRVPRYSVGGTVTSYLGTPMEGVTILLGGFQQGQAVTNAQGWFQFVDLLGAESYTLTPSYAPPEGAWSFNPSIRTIQLLNGDRWGEDFVGTPPFYPISGTVRTEEGHPRQGVTVVLSGDAADTTVTGVNGSYAFGGLPGGRSYTVTPSYLGPEGAWSFQPPSYSFDPLLGPQQGRDFVAVRPRYAIGGSVLQRDRSPLPGVRVRLVGGMSDSTLTNASGQYGFADVPGGLAYTIVPSLAYDDSVGWGFTPPHISVGNLVGDLSNQDFIAQLPVLLTVGDGAGHPGSVGNPVVIALDNQTYQPLALDSLSFVLTYSAEHGVHVPPEGGLEPETRTQGWSVTYRVDETYAPSCSLFVSLRRGQTPLAPGVGPICTVLFTLDASADTACATRLAFSTATAWDTTGFEIPVDFRDTGVFGTGQGADPARKPALVLHPPLPNPAHGEVAIGFALPRASRTSVVIRDLTGRIVAELDQGILPAGEHRVVWRGRDIEGKPVPNGTYHCQLVACGQTASTLLVLLR